MSSLRDGFKTIPLGPLAAAAYGSNDVRVGASSQLTSKSLKRLVQDTSAYPRMEPVAMPESPFLARVYDLTCDWVQDEWLVIDAIKREPSRNRKSLDLAIRESRLTLDTLASRLDNISQATLSRELRRLNAPSPGEIIRSTRLSFAKHLLVHTRMLVRDVALRAGYESPRHFSKMFARAFGVKPSEVRRNHIRQTAAD